jgi:hypothetical protein
MARSIHGFPKVSPGPSLPDPSTPCGRSIPETTLQTFLGWPARRAGGLWLSSTPLHTPRHTGLQSNTFVMSWLKQYNNSIVIRLAARASCMSSRQNRAYSITKLLLHFNDQK